MGNVRGNEVRKSAADRAGAAVFGDGGDSSSEDVTSRHRAFHMSRFEVHWSANRCISKKQRVSVNGLANAVSLLTWDAFGSDVHEWLRKRANEENLPSDLG